MKKRIFTGAQSSMKCCMLFSQRALLLTVALFMLFFTITAQDKKITIKQTNKQLSEILNEIEAKSGYSFLVRSSDLNLNQSASIDAKDKSITEILSILFKNKDISYEVSGNRISIFIPQKPAEKLPIQKSTKKITGIVTDEKGDPIIGASIIDNATKNGTISDVNGNFTIDVSDKTLLSISYIGYTTTSTSVGNQHSLTIRLKEDTRVLDEIVVVGYGTQKKVNLTGAVGTVNLKMIEDRPSDNILKSLQGMVPGVTIISRPDYATINIRGRGNLGASSPLYIVDGIEVDYAFFNSLSPSSIEAISFLKDAASAAIYGAKAAYGVILVTTKSGKKGELVVTYNGSAGTKQALMIPKVLNSWEYAEMYRTAELNSGVTESNLLFKLDDIANYKSGTNPDIYPNTNWFDLVLKPSALYTRHNMEFSGGSDKMRFVLGLGYMKDETLIPGEGTDRYNFTSKTIADFKPWLSVSSNINFIYNKHENSGQASFRNFLTTPPTQVARQTNGEYGSVRDMRENSVDGNSNPLRQLEKSGRSNSARKNFLGTITAVIKPFEGFSIHNQIGYNYWDYQGFSFLNKMDPIPSFLNPGTFIPGSESDVNEMNIGWQYAQKLIYDGWVSYNKTFKQIHDISFIGGIHADTRIWQDLSTGRKMFPSNDLNAINGGSIDPANQLTTYGSVEEESMLSYFGRATYAFDQKYLLEANFRADASSRFAKEGRWGYFPSFSAGWRVDREKFMTNLDWINNLKIRASWGENGNINNVGLYDTYSTFLANGTTYLGGEVVPILSEGRVGNRKLSWERTSATNIGVDLDIKNGLLNLTVDYYNRMTNGILIRANDVLVETGLGGGNIPARNVGSVQNKGIELSLLHRNEIGKVSYMIGGNMALNQNKIVDLGKNIDQLPPSSPYILRKGGSIGDFYMFQADGLYSTADIAEGKAIPYGQQVPEAGMIKFIDQLTEDTNSDGIPDAGDGVIDDKDRTIVGNDVPDFTFGLNMEVSYKNFTLSAVGQGVTGVTVYMDNEASQAFFDKSVPREWQKNNWTPDNESAAYPRLLLPTDVRYAYNSIISSYWLFDASYFRIKNLTLSYNFPKHFVKSLGIEKARIYVSGDNQFTIRGDKRMKDFDPERSSGRGAEFGLKTITSGISITL